MNRSEALTSLLSKKSLRVEFSKNDPYIYFASNFEALIMKQSRGDICSLFFKLKGSPNIYGGIILTQNQVDNFIKRNFKEI